MHSFVHKKLPLSFNNTWQTNEERNPVRVMRNINDLYIPAHRVEFVKRLPLFSFPAKWNSAPGDKSNPRTAVYIHMMTPDDNGPRRENISRMRAG
jgi:hypothetical protein